MWAPGSCHLTTDDLITRTTVGNLSPEMWRSVFRQVNRSVFRDRTDRRERNGRFEVEIYVDIQSVPRSKHIASRLYKPVS